MNQCSLTSQKSNGQKGREFKSIARSVMWDYALVSVFKNTTQYWDCDVSAGDGRSSKAQHITINQYVTKQTYFTKFYATNYKVNTQRPAHGMLGHLPVHVRNCHMVA